MEKKAKRAKRHVVKESVVDKPVPLTSEQRMEKEALLMVIDATSQVLAEEMEAIRAGDANLVMAMLERKTEVAERLEETQPRIEAFLQATRDSDLIDRVRVLDASLKDNARCLQQMIGAIQNITKAISKVYEKKKSDGIYGYRGKKLDSPVVMPRQVDGKF
jgi:hypothetical protein